MPFIFMVSIEGISEKTIEFKIDNLCAESSPLISNVGSASAKPFSWASFNAS